MAGDTQSSSSSSEPQHLETWNTQQHESALAHLERLQEQLDNLRSTIPSLVAPMYQQPQSREALFTAVRKSAAEAVQDVKAFREDWNSEQTQELLARSKLSLERNGDLSRAVDVARWGWGVH